MKITAEIRNWLNETKKSLTGYGQRHFMAETVETFCEGKAQKAEQALGWNRKTIKKAMEERGGQFCYVDQRHLSGRKKAEDHLPNLLNDLNEIAEQFSQTDPTFRTTRLFTRLTASEMRTQLIEQKGYTDAALPCEETLRKKLNALGYGSKRVKKVNR
jgi:CRISPR/Cas system CMR-associated protein Cmr5 small subunit